MSVEAASEVRLEDLTPGAAVRGIVPGGLVTVVAVRWHGTSAVTLTYRDAEGRPAERLVYRDEEASLLIESQGRAWSFDADGNLFRLASEARRIRLAHLFDPMLAVHLSALEPLPHQIQAVYGEMLPRQPLRFLLADDPGAGKTIMTGLLIKELGLRGALRRCLIVAPGGLVTQWQDELAEKFGLQFDLLTRDAIEAAHLGNPFANRNHVIARLDHLARNDDLQAKLSGTEWDLIVVDEAHRMAAHWLGTEIKHTRRYRLGQLLGGLTRHFLLLTATPHNGKEEDFQLFLALLDADRFEGRFRDGVHTADVSDLMRRMVKERLLRFDGRPLFPERVASTVPYALSDIEAELYGEVTQYVTEEMNRADRLRDAGEGRRGNRIGFALTVLQRRLASSPEAIYQSLSRRRKRLEDRVAEEKLVDRTRSARGRSHSLLEELESDDDPDRFDDLADDELEELEEDLVDEATAARTVAELGVEIGVLRRLEALALRVRRSGQDRKWAELSGLVQNESAMRSADGSRRKLIIFTEHRDTLNYLVERLSTLLGRSDAVVAIHGGVKRELRRAAQEIFTQDASCVVLVATDAAGEGINLQRAHLLVNYDLPWNPNRIEQRFGRIHRIGQTEVCHMWNLVAEETREGQVYRRLLEKLEEQRKALGGQVFDVLGQVFPGVALRDLLLKAIRYGDDPEVRAQLDQVIDAQVGEGLSDLLDTQALAADVLGPAEVERIRARLDEAEARRLQPHYTRAFFLEALRNLGGRAREREAGRFEVTHVPIDVRRRDRVMGNGAPIIDSYERICFERDLVQPPGQPVAELVAPGHPLLEAVLDLVGERHSGLLKQGSVLVDDGDPHELPRVLLYLEHAIADARAADGADQNVVSRRFEFVEMTEDGQERTMGPAPYLDYRPVDEEERDLVGHVVGAAWLGGGLDARAVDVAIERAVPEHLAAVRARTLGRVAKVRTAVRERLVREINYWDARAVRLREEAEAGKQPRINPARAQARADELAARLEGRMVELDQEQQLTALPPTVVGGALVVPAGLLARLRGERSGSPDHHARETERVERRAVDAVLAAEEALGRRPEEMARNNPGYDIRSHQEDGHLLFIEVKGRISGAATVTVTRNEILHALNVPDRHVLALVEVRPDDSEEVRYLRRAFDGMEGRVHFAETSVNFDWKRLWRQGGIPT